MNDYIVRGVAAGGQIRAFAATTRNVVETARQHHEMSPIATLLHLEDFSQAVATMSNYRRKTTQMSLQYRLKVMVQSVR